MPRVNTALLIIAFVRQSGHSAYCHCRREEVLIEGMTDVGYRSVITMAHESGGCLRSVNTLLRDHKGNGMEDLRFAGLCLNVACYHSHDGQSRATRRGGVRRAMRSRWGLSHSLPRQEWQPQACLSTAGEAPSDLAQGASSLEQEPRCCLRGCSTVNHRSTRHHHSPPGAARS